MNYSVYYIFILFISTSVALACDTKCFHNCSELNASPTCFYHCGCQPEKQQPRNPQLTREFVKNAIGIMKRHAPECNRSYFHDCSSFQNYWDYERCVEYYGCTSLLDPDIWKNELPQELWKEVQPHILLYKTDNLACRKQCDQICQENSEPSLCTEQCRNEICYENLEISTVNREYKKKVVQCIENCNQFCGEDRSCKGSCFRDHCVHTDYVITLKEVIEKDGLERDTYDEQSGDPSASQPQPGQPSTADDRTPYEIEFQDGNSVYLDSLNPESTPYSDAESESTVRMLVIQMLGPACLVLACWILYGRYKKAKSIRRYRYDDIYSKTPYKRMRVKV